MSDRKHHFSESNVKRRALVVYGSVGKGGLFLPQDFIKRAPSIDDDVLDDDQDMEPQPFVPRSATQSAQSAQPSQSTQSTEPVPVHVDSPQGELQPLLLPLQVPYLATSMRRHLLVHQELVDQERELLESNHIVVPHLSNGLQDDDIEAAFDQAVKENTLHTNAWIELRLLVSSLIPLVLTFLLQNSLLTVSVFSVGHLGATELAAVSMGAMTANITGYATIQGIATALDTLCPQAFGAKKYHLVGIYIQKCIALILTLMFPILIIWVFYGYQLIALLVPDKDTARLAAVYLQYIAPGIPAYVLFECGKRFLMAQGIYHISTYVLLVAAPLNAVMNWVLVMKLGYYGAPIAVAINYWLMAALLLLGTIYGISAQETPSGIHPLECWGGLNVRNAFKGWFKLAGLAIPGLIMLEAEFLAFEVLTLFASYLGTVALAAQLIGTTMASLTYQVPFAIGIASSTRIANFLGAGMGSAAKLTTQVALAFGLVISVLNFLLLYVFQYQIARLFTGDEEVIKTVTNVMWLIATMQIVDAMNANSAGTLRGQGQTKIGGIVNLFLYYVVGLPLSLYLLFSNKYYKGSLDGLWIGSTVALAIIGTVQLLYSLFADFDQLCDEAYARTSDTVV